MRALVYTDEAHFFATSPNALADAACISELRSANGPEIGKHAFAAILDEASHFTAAFGWPKTDALYRALALRGLLEPYTAWRIGRITPEQFLNYLSNTSPHKRRLPKRLYRFMSLNSEERIEFVRQLLADGQLYLATPSSMNDPDDCRPRLSSRKEELELLAIAEPRVGLSSFSENNLHDLMWAHYADGARGVCIELDAAHILEHEERTGTTLLCVNYVPALRQQRPPGWLTSTTNAMSFIAEKKDVWSYEQEWRLTLMSPTPLSQANRTVEFGEPLVTGVFVGKRASEKNRSTIELFAARRKIPVAISTQA
jgi:hypothetical protein